MPIPTWSSGQVLAATDINNYFVPKVAYKSADLTRASNAALTSDPDLTIPLAASSVYIVNFAIIFSNSLGTPGFTFGWAVPSGSTGEYVAWYWFTASAFIGATGNAGVTWATARSPYVNAGGDMGLTGQGTIFTSSTSANLTFQWCQASSNATGTIVRAGSCLSAQKAG